MLNQVAGEVAKTGSSITGQFVLDGALLIAAFKVVEEGLRLLAKKVRGTNGNGKVVKPGEGKLCGEHTTALAVVDTKVSNLEKAMWEIKDDIRAIRTAVEK